MRKTVILFFTLFVIISSLHTQNYIFEYDVEFFLNSARRNFDNNLYYTTANSAERKEMTAFKLYKERRSHFRIKGQTLIPATEGPIVHMWADSYRRVKAGVWVKDGKYSTEHYRGSANETEFTRTDLAWGTMSTYYSHTVTHVYRFYPQLQFANSQPTLLPSKDKVVISNTAGFPRSVYKWQYSLNGASSWIDVPISVINLSPLGSLRICGMDLMDEEAYQQLAAQGKPILFRIFNSVKSSETISLQASLSSPYIISHNIHLETCHQAADAAIKVTLDRPLYRGEALSCFVNGQSLGSSGNISLDRDNSFILNGYAAGLYNLSLKGSYNGNSTYADDSKHKLVLTIAERLAITHSFTKKDISCWGGRDGSITFTASGGTGRFTATLTDSKGTEQKQTFATGTMTFRRLVAGDYSLRLQDSNGCVAKTATGQELIHRITLTEPGEAVSIGQGTLVSPLAHHSSDGSIQIIVTGGTPAPSGYTVRFIRKEDNRTFSPTETRSEGNRYIYTLRNISRGQYTAVVEDMRYVSLAGEDKQEPCGCYAKLAIILTAPPPLTVKVEETHFVSCHDDADGELTAHAKGGKPITTVRLPYTYTWYKVNEGAKETLALQTDSIARHLEAGRYQVKITDANGISTKSTVFELVHPDPLAVNFTTRSPSCSGGSGLVTATVTGGTAPYTYEWNKEGATKPTLSIYEAGSYFVRVVDSRGCSITGNVEVTAPDEITVVPTLTHPACFGAANGAISLALSGGTAPYTVRWEDDHTLTATERKNLKAGEYTAVISDWSGCSLRYRMQLNQPDAMAVTLSEGFTLCNGQSHKIKATTDADSITYQWLHDGQVLSETGHELLVNKAGRYRVVITNLKGCTATAEVEIKTSTIDLPLDITVPTAVTLGTPVHAVNISRVRADKLEWILPENAVITGTSDERAVFTIPVPGIYEVSLIGYSGDCSTMVVQRLEVLGEGELTLPDGKGEMITQFLVTPNSTEGEFKVYVELKEPHDFTLRLLSPTGVEMDKKKITQTQKRTFEYELRGDAEGIFGVELMVGNERSVLKITKERK